MIIRLKGANFSDNNIGTLSTVSVLTDLGNGATYNGTSSAEKDKSFSATITLAENYEVGSAGVTVTMGGQPLSGAVTISGKTITINIASVTGTIKITVPTKNTASGEEVDPNLPTATTWYVQSASTALSNEIASTNTSNGWTYQSTAEQEAIRNKPINALQIATTSTSGTMYVAIADSKGATSVHDVTKGTFTKSNTSKEVVTVKLEKTLTLTDGQYLIFEPAGVAPTRNYNLYYADTSATGVTKNGFLSRIPTDTSGTSSAWKENANMSIGISTGYYVEGSTGNNPSTTTETWYVDKASTSYTTEVKTDNTTYGWAYSTADEIAAIRNKPINAVKFATTSTSGTVTIGVVKGLAANATITEVYNVQSATFTKSGTAKELVTVVFDNEFTLGDDEYLIFEPSNKVNGLNYNHYYRTSGGAGFYSRIPADISGQNKPITAFSGYDIGYATGYVNK